MNCLPSHASVMPYHELGLQIWEEDLSYEKFVFRIIGKMAVDLARADIFGYIEVFYNRTRRHSHLGQVSLEASERASL